MTPSFQPIEIAGGGLAGLALGLNLRRAGVPTTVIEAGQYPRHRVCGEFIAGLRPATIERLGLAPFLSDAIRHREVAWFRGRECINQQTLPEPALAISRYALDERLAQAFVGAGGDLRTGERADVSLAEPGRVNATGRARSGQPWLGLKLHVRSLPLVRGLEMHLGDEAYVGLCALPGGEVNVCGLFRRRFLPARTEAGALVSYLRVSGLAELAERIVAAETVPGSAVAVAGLGFDPPEPGEVPRVGDAAGMLPPFLGNGMAAAFQTAEDALQPLVTWSREGGDWEKACAAIQQRIGRRLRRRRWWSRLLHPFLLNPSRQLWVQRLARAPRASVDLLYQATH